MPLIGLHASHEQFAPARLLDLVRRAEAAGFDAAMCSDHFHPWTEAQGQSGHAWSWLGAAMAVTALPLGVVTSPAGRYHPAVVAQAAATLEQMFPGRFWMAAGSGEALNEAITGQRWPSKAERNARLLEAVAVMRALWRGEAVDHRGAITVQEARLYTLPPAPPPVFVAALSEETARWGGGWADGLITVSMPRERLRRVVEAFREGGGEGKPLRLQVKLAYAGSDAEALAGAHAQWRANVFGGEVSEVLRTPAQYEAAAAHVTPQDVAAAVRVAADAGRQLAWLREDLEMGFDALYLHNVHPEQERFVDDLGPRLAGLR
ncbi:MAG TPA: TIGR03885 family FMN-dependent LLM class oxidoreductase [Pseudoxanthomonas sp.]|nr:TIGR03885 family FMN-dependent LLM class oxidoreductase [Pseudoxanthomonas sp.]